MGVGRQLLVRSNRPWAHVPTVFMRHHVYWYKVTHNVQKPTYNDEAMQDFGPKMGGWGGVGGCYTVGIYAALYGKQKRATRWGGIFFSGSSHRPQSCVMKYTCMIGHVIVSNIPGAFHGTRTNCQH